MNVYLKAAFSLLVFIVCATTAMDAKAQCTAKIVTDSVTFSNGASVARPDALAAEGASKVYQLTNFSINGIKQKNANVDIVKQLGFRKGYTFTATHEGLQAIAQKVCGVNGYRLKTLTMVMDATTADAAMLTFDFER